MERDETQLTRLEHIGLFPRKLEQVYNLLKLLVGYDPLGRGAPFKKEEKPKPERVEKPPATSLLDLTRRIYDKAKAEPALRFQRKRKGFGWKRWSSKELFDKLGLFDDFRVKYFEPLAKALPNHAVT